MDDAAQEKKTLPPHPSLYKLLEFLPNFEIVDEDDLGSQHCNGGSRGS